METAGAHVGDMLPDFCVYFLMHIVTLICILMGTFAFFAPVFNDPLFCRYMFISSSLRNTAGANGGDMLSCSWLFFLIRICTTMCKPMGTFGFFSRAFHGVPVCQ